MSERSSSKEASITFWGAAEGSVTGSCNVLEFGQKGQSNYNKVVIDCGIFQGPEDLRKMYGKNAREYEAIQQISEGNSPILLTHSHIDHAGFIPRIFKFGFTPLIYATSETKKIIEKNLMRSAKAQQRGLYKNEFSFGVEDVEKAMRYVQIVEPYQEVPVSRDKNIVATFCPNGHILGSCSVIIKDRVSGKNVLVTGDIGRPEQMMVGGYNRYADKYPQDPIHAVVTESTCYTSSPIPFEKRIDTFQREFKTAFQRGNVVLMPCIQHRYMENREIIHNCQKQGKISKNIDFFVDGPALEDIADLYKELPPDYLTKRYGDDPCFYDTESSKSRFSLTNLKTIIRNQDSLFFRNGLNDIHKKTIVFTSGGMGDDGRAHNYLKKEFFLSPKDTVAFSCYLVDGTRGSDLLKEQNLPEYCGPRIIKLEGGSSHATGPEEIFGYLRRYNLEDVENLFIVHGNETSRKSMEIGIRQTDFGEYVNVVLPKIGERIDLV